MTQSQQDDERRLQCTYQEREQPCNQPVYAIYHHVQGVSCYCATHFALVLQTWNNNMRAKRKQ